MRCFCYVHAAGEGRDGVVVFVIVVCECGGGGVDAVVVFGDGGDRKKGSVCDGVEWEVNTI